MTTKKKTIATDDTFVNRPLGKPDETVRGRLLKWNGSDYVAFEPQKSKDTPARTILKESKGGTYYRNEGENTNSYSLHLNVDGTESDPAAVLLDKALAILKPYLKDEPRIEVRNFLEDMPGLQVWQRKKKGQLCAFITIETTLPKEQMSGRLFRLCSEINKIIDSNKF